MLLPGIHQFPLWALVAVISINSPEASQNVSEVDLGLTLLNVHKWLTPASQNVTSMLQCVSSKGEDTTFSRMVDTGHGLQMPTGMSHRSPTSGLIRELASENGPSRFGVYSCQAEPSSTKVVAFKLPHYKTAEIKAEKMFLTVRPGQEVTMFVNRERREDPSEMVRWRHNGNLIPEWDNSFNGTLFNASAKDSGIYECYNEGRRAKGLHALFKVYVFRCPEGKYGSTCESDCQPCYNGGICHEDSGTCICPPGFRGVNCEIPCGPNTFGLNCSHVCYPHEAHITSEELRDSCAFYWFCLTDPYGCTCGSGFRGPLCTEYCEPGTYGVDCSQKCHCADDKTPCDIVTGQCGTSGGCADGWTGTSCQIREPPSIENAPIKRYANSSAIHLSWDTWTFENNSGGWPDTEAEYMLFLLNNADSSPMWPTWRNVTETWVADLEPNTEYNFFIKTRDALRWWRPQGVERPFEKQSQSLKVFTECAPLTERSVPKNFIARIVEDKAIHLAWERPSSTDVQCNLDGYTLSRWVTGSKETTTRTFDLRPERVSYKLDSLQRNTSYTISLSVKTDVGSWLPGAEIVVKTPPGESPSVKELTAFFQFDILHLGWEAPKLSEKGATVLKYTVDVFLLNLNACQAIPQDLKPMSHVSKVSKIELLDIVPYATYEISVTPVVSKGPKGRPVAIVYTTPETAPSRAPENLTVHYFNETALSFTWFPLPCQYINANPSEVDYEWTLEAKVPEKQDDVVKFNGRVTSKELGETNTPLVLVQGVPLKSEYIFAVRAYTSFGNGPKANISRAFSEDESLSLENLQQTSSSIWLRVDDNTDTTHSVYQISICEDPSSNEFFNCSLATVEYRRGEPQYESMQLEQRNLLPSTNYTFKVQRQTKYGTWGPWSKTFIFETHIADYDEESEVDAGISGELENKSEIVVPNALDDERDVAIVAESSEVAQKKTVSCGILILIVIAALLILVIIITVAIYYYRRRQSRHHRFVVKGDKNYKRTSAEVAPLNASSEESTRDMTKESSFKDVPLNSVSNRSSVLLCDGFIQKGEFILTKMPSESKQEWFWSHVYSHKSSVIVMLNDCEFIDDNMAVPGQYWPHGDSFSRQFGRFSVDVVQTEEKGRVNIRTMRVKDTHQEDSEPLGVVQLQYLDDWDAEKGVPKSCTSFMGLVLLALAQKQKRGGTITVHCQDGEVRSGLFCVCCFLKQESDFGGRGDVMRAVRHFQTQRRPVLDNEEQLRFGLELAGLLASDEPKATIKHNHGSEETFV